MTFQFSRLLKKAVRNREGQAWTLGVYACPTTQNQQFASGAGRPVWAFSSALLEKPRINASAPWADLDLSLPRVPFRACAQAECEQKRISRRPTVFLIHRSCAPPHC